MQHVSINEKKNIIETETEFKNNFPLKNIIKKKNPKRSDCFRVKKLVCYRQAY